MPKMTVDRQRALTHLLEQMQQTPAQQTALGTSDVLTRIATLARILAEVLAAFGPSPHAQAVDDLNRAPKQ